jgi:hypothetical protein
VPGLTEQLLMYYLGVGFVVLLAWAARDIVAQVGLDIPENHPIARTHHRTTTLVNALAIASFLPIAALLVVARIS